MRRWQAWIIGVAVIVALLMFWCWHIAQNSPVAQVQRELERLRKMGEPLSYRDLLPPVPSHLDATPLYRKAIAQLEAVQTHPLFQAWKFPPGSAPPGKLVIAPSPPPSARPMLPVKPSANPQVVQLARPALTTLRQAVKLPHMRLTKWEDSPAATGLFLHLARFRDFARLLCEEALWHKQQGDVDGAVESCVVALRLARRMGDEPGLAIGFLVQNAVLAFGQRALWDVLSDAEASPHTYRSLLTELQSWDIDRDFVRALKMERVVNSIRWFEQLRKVPLARELRRLKASWGWSGLDWNLALYVRSKGTLLAENQLLLLRHWERVLVHAHKGVPYDLAALKRLDKEMDRQTQGITLIDLSRRVGLKVVWQPKEVAALAMPPFCQQLFTKASQAHALQRLTQAVVALRLYRYEHGRYPDGLQALVPKFLPKVPIDPFDGKPLRYRKLPKGFKVWSVGPNLKDDGGQHHPLWGVGTRAATLFGNRCKAQAVPLPYIAMPK